MIRIEDDIKVWVSSDTHFSHKNICRGGSGWISAVEKDFNDGKITSKEFDDKMKLLLKQTRPFKNLEEMNETIIKNINDNVQQDDVFFHFGDWSFGGYENIKIFWDRLICKNIYLFLGNHDHHIENNRGGCRGLFKKVTEYDTIQYRGETIEGFHYPITSWNGLRKGRIHIHGHCHLPPDKKISGGRRIDAGLDGHPEFRPYDLYREIIVPMQKIIIGSELGGSDHHADNEIKKD